LRAATRPKVSGALYFVATGDGDGGHHFSRSLAEHEKAIQPLSGKTEGERQFKLAATAIDKKRGKFITLEGGEGVGKSTQMAAVDAALQSAGLETFLTREPGGTERRSAIRELLLRPTAEPMPVSLRAAADVRRTGHPPGKIRYCPLWSGESG